jgi:hypothetical protein
MTAPTIPLVEQPLRPLGRARATLKGRQSDEAALREVRVLIGAPPEGGHRRDLLIEHLHRLQDHFGHLSARHLAALAREMGLAQTEVYEVATFYHHFDIVADDVLAGDGGLGPARPGRRGLSRPGASGASCASSRAAPDGREHRRRRARHLQGPHLPGTRPAPLSGRRADRRPGGGHRGLSTSTCATNTTAAAPLLQGELARLRPSRLARCRTSNCAAVPAPTSAAKSRP